MPFKWAYNFDNKKSKFPVKFIEYCGIFDFSSTFYDDITNEGKIIN